MVNNWIQRGWCAWHEDWGMMRDTYAETRQAAWKLWKVRMFNCPRSTAEKVDIVEVSIRRLAEKRTR